MSSSGSGIIFQWLDRIGLGAVVPLFEQRGINSPQLLMKLDEADYPSIGVTGDQEKRRLSELVNRVRQAAHGAKQKHTAQGSSPAKTTSSGAQPLASVSSPSHEGTTRPVIPQSRVISPKVYDEDGDEADDGDSVGEMPAMGRARGGPISRKSLMTGVSDAYADEARSQRPAAAAAPPSGRDVSGTRAKTGVDRDGFAIKTRPKPRPTAPAFDRVESLPYGGEGEDDGAVGGYGDAPAAVPRKPRPSLAPGAGPSVQVMPSQRARLEKMQRERQSVGGAGARPPVLDDEEGDDDDEDVRGYQPEQPKARASAAVVKPRAAPVAAPAAGNRKSLAPSGMASGQPVPSRPAPRPSPPAAPPAGYFDEDDESDSPYQQQQHQRAAPSAPLSTSGLLDDAGTRIKVVVRKRPMNGREFRGLKGGAEDCMDVVQVASRRALRVHERKERVTTERYIESHEFVFDEVFGEDVSTEDVYRHTAQPLVGGLFKGTNATCFAYGQTGSGKTYTMMGPVKDLASGGDGGDDPASRSTPGLYVLAARDIFSQLRRHEASFGRDEKPVVVVSFFEIYGNRLYDLLGERSEVRALVDAKEKVQMIGLSEQRVGSVEELLRCIDTGNRARSTGSTGANEDSSRSHAVLSIKLATERYNAAGKYWHIVEDPSTRMAKSNGKISFVDLAGSERGADTTFNDKKVRTEGAEINKSLLALKECIRSLYQSAGHQPFRGSKLTQVLKDSFIGDSRTVMIATISPTAGNCEHSLNTLRYAFRVKEYRSDSAARVGGSDAPYEMPHGGSAAAQFSAADFIKMQRPQSALGMRPGPSPANGPGGRYGDGDDDLRAPSPDAAVGAQGSRQSVAPSARPGARQAGRSSLAPASSGYGGSAGSGGAGAPPTAAPSGIKRASVAAGAAGGRASGIPGPKPAGGNGVPLARANSAPRLTAVQSRVASSAPLQGEEDGAHRASVRGPGLPRPLGRASAAAPVPPVGESRPMSAPLAPPSRGAQPRLEPDEGIAVEEEEEGVGEDVVDDAEEAVSLQGDDVSPRSPPRPGGFRASGDIDSEGEEGESEVALAPSPVRASGTPTRPAPPRTAPRTEPHTAHISLTDMASVRRGGGGVGPPKSGGSGAFRTPNDGQEESNDVAEEEEEDAEEARSTPRRAAQRHLEFDGGLGDAGYATADPAAAREARLARVRASLRGERLTDDEVHLLKSLLPLKEQLQAVSSRLEALLVRGASSWAGASPHGSRGSALPPPLSRGDMAQAVNELVEIGMQAGIAAGSITDLAVGYREAYGAQVGLVDPEPETP